MQASVQKHWLAQITAWYDALAHNCDCQPLDITVQAIDLTQWQLVYQSLLKDAYDGKLNPKDLSPGLIRNTYNELVGGAAKGYGSNFKVVGDDGTPNATAIAMRQNLFKFSGAKTYSQQLLINQALTQNGKPASWNDFKAAGLKLNQAYNVNYLQAEYQTAKQAGYHAANWATYMRDAKDFPNLKYVTQNDERVRDSHQSLHGIIAPLNGDFWAKYYPPNGWRCRCYVVQTAENPSADIPTKVPDVKPEFEINTGISGQVFKEGANGGKPAPYFALAKADPNFKKALEFSKFTAPLETVEGVKISPFADVKDLKDNFIDAKILVKNHKADMEIRPHIDVEDFRNPEYLIDGLLADRFAGTLKAGFDKKSRQIREFVKKYNEEFPSKKVKETYGIVFNLQNIDDNAARLINGKFKNGKKLEVVFLIKGKKSIKINRADSYSLIEEKLKML